MSNTIADLPPEMIVKIFDHLDHRERLLASRTCKAWRTLAFSPKFYKRLYLHLGSTSDLVSKLRGDAVYERCRNAIISCDGIEDEHRSLLIDYLRNAPLEMLQIVTVKDTAKWILEHHLTGMEMLETLHLNLRNCEGEMLRISHPTLRTAIFERPWAFEIDCPNLRAVESYLMDEKCVNFISGLRGQLQSLKLSSREKRFYTALSNVEWDNLRELHLVSALRGNDLERLLERMPCLKKLSLEDHYTVASIGKEFGALKRLSELVLSRLKIDAEGFNKSLERLTQLESLSIISCIFTPIGEESRLESRSIKRFTYVKRKRDQLPHFPNLKILDLECGEHELYNTLKDICNCYLKLERLCFGVAPGLIGTFQTESEFPATKSFSHLKKLKSLTALQLNRISVKHMDWSTCNENQIKWLRLEGCSIDGVAAQQLVHVFKQLRQLFLDHCYLQQLRTDVFDIDENCTKGLRTHLPGCRMSYYDCHIEESHETCGGRRDAI